MCSAIPCIRRAAVSEMVAMETIGPILQVIVGLGLLNVWLLRARNSTPYRGGEAKSLREEFAEYGLPKGAFYLVGALKIGAAIALLVGLALPALVLPAAIVIIGLMLGALAMHVRVGDPAMRSVPAALMLLMSGSIAWIA